MPSNYLPNMKLLILLIPFMLSSHLFSQQLADTTYDPNIRSPAYDKGKGSVVFIDEGHHNFHTKSGRYKAFSNLLERDGYNVHPYSGVFKRNELAKGKILVISNALHERNVNDWFIPVSSAFTKSEIAVVREWVYTGGSLFLIADHMPMGGAAKDLAAAFNFEFTNGFVFDSIAKGPAYFTLQDGTLAESIITKGRSSSESVRQIATFTGQAIKVPEDATSILTFTANYVIRFPDTAWVFHEETNKVNAGGWSQGAYKKFGRGKIVVFGEAAMFTAQVSGPGRIKMGMNHESASGNYQLLLNIIHWLDGKLD